jgi:hypothetical protein
VRFKRPLTDPELDLVKAAAAIGPAAAIVTFYDVALADEGSCYEDEETINPREFSIPRTQTVEILTASNPWIGLDWMNVGPSSYEEEER